MKRREDVCRGRRFERALLLVSKPAASCQFGYAWHGDRCRLMRASKEEKKKKKNLFLRLQEGDLSRAPGASRTRAPHGHLRPVALCRIVSTRADAGERVRFEPSHCPRVSEPIVAAGCTSLALPAVGCVFAEAVPVGRNLDMSGWRWSRTTRSPPWPGGCTGPWFVLQPP